MRALLAAVSTFLPAASLLATTITVNSLTDASGCSLRNAIVAANTNAASGGCTAGSGADDISVAVAGTYAPASPLPEISSIVTITATTGNFELNGANAGAADGIRFVSGSAGSRLTGLVINGFSGSGVVLNTSGITLTQNRIGTDRFGVSPIPNCSGAPSSAGVLVDGVIHQTNVIGGSSSTDRNLISGNACIGVRVVTGAATISNNYIGTDYTGSNAIPNGDKGVAIETTSDNRVTNNVLSGNTVAQIIVASGRLHLEGNLIGSNAAGTARLANAPFADGVRALGAGAIVTVVFNRFV
ncbi:MAG TPA: hypothetical protein VF057_11475, partial [Thermoanaerobaculia bacterium]